MKANWINLWTGVSVIVLVGSEIFACFCTGAWAVSGLMRLGPIVDYGLMLVAIAISIGLTVIFSRFVLAAEPFLERRSEGSAASDATGQSEVLP